MGSPIIFSGTRSKALSSKGLLLKSGATIDNDGKKNYITQGNFENKLSTGWSLFHTTLSNLVPNQASGSWTSASANLSKALVSSGQLAGAYSLSVASSAATTAGDMLVSDAYTIDIEDQGKVLTSSFYYSAITNSTNNNFSGTSANTWQVYIYDVANSAWIQPSAVYGMNQGTGVGYVTCQWQTPINMTSFRLAVVCCNASAGATTLYFDDFCTCPSQYVYGSPVTDWVAYTPTTTGFGTSSSVQFLSRRVGGNLEIVGRLTPGTLSGVTVQITLGYNGGNGNVTVNNSIIPVNTIVGYGGTARIGPDVIQVMAAGGQNYVTLTPANASISGFSPALGTNFSGSAIGFQASIPITGWSSSVQMSDSAALNVVSSFYSGTHNAATSGNPIIQSGSKSFYDTTNSFSTSTGRYTVPVSGYYEIKFYINDGAFTYQVYKNAIVYDIIGALQANGIITGSLIIPCIAGDLLDIRPNGTLGNGNLSYMSFTRLSGPSAIAATETVSCRYTTAAGQSIPNTGAVVDFGTKVWDSTGSVTTGASWKFTAPISGEYKVNAAVLYTSAAWFLNTGINLQLHKNGFVGGAEYSMFAVSYPQVSNTYFHGINGTATIKLLAGDFISVATDHGEATNRALFAGATYNFIEIIRTGNF